MLPLGGVVVTWFQWASVGVTKKLRVIGPMISVSFHFSFKDCSGPLRISLKNNLLEILV
jgi:hypothetical protein